MDERSIQPAEATIEGCFAEKNDRSQENLHRREKAAAQRCASPGCRGRGTELYAGLCRPCALKGRSAEEAERRSTPRRCPFPGCEKDGARRFVSFCRRHDPGRVAREF